MKSGDRFINSQGLIYEVVRYVNFKHIEVRFINTSYSYAVTGTAIKKGTVKDRLHPNVYGVGYIGVGVSAVKNGKMLRTYNQWVDMLRRCYFQKDPRIAKNYKGCSVHEDWFNFQNFYQWASNQFGFEKKGWELDKDLLVQGNRVYGPHTCSIIPAEINIFLTYVHDTSDTLPGVSKKRSGKFIARLQFSGKSLCLGTFDTEQEAFCLYCKVKNGKAKDLGKTWETVDEPWVHSLLNFSVEQRLMSNES